MGKAKINDLVDFKLPPKDCPSKVTPFVFLNPLGDEIFEVGSKVAIYWKGGPPLPQTVRIYLIDVEAWATIANIVPSLVVNNSPGFYQWTIPLTWLQTHNHTQYQIYIEDVARTTWLYGHTFKIT
ncbi:MAG TPA: Ser-Thr-rich GPI-anchored membrane family protein [Ignavibacteria bacterium]